jgi:hypothetical protein
MTKQIIYACSRPMSRMNAPARARRRGAAAAAGGAAGGGGAAAGGAGAAAGGGRAAPSPRSSARLGDSRALPLTMQSAARTTRLSLLFSL